MQGPSWIEQARLQYEPARKELAMQVLQMVEVSTPEMRECLLDSLPLSRVAALVNNKKELLEAMVAVLTQRVQLEKDREKQQPQGQVSFIQAMLGSTSDRLQQQLEILKAELAKQ